MPEALTTQVGTPPSQEFEEDNIGQSDKAYGDLSTIRLRLCLPRHQIPEYARLNRQRLAQPLGTGRKTC